MSSGAVCSDRERPVAAGKKKRDGGSLAELTSVKAACRIRLSRGEEREPVGGRPESVAESQGGEQHAISLKTLRLHGAESVPSSSGTRSGGAVTMAPGDSSIMILANLVVMNSDSVAGKLEHA